MYFGVGEFGLGGFPDADSLSVPDPLPGLLTDTETAREFLMRATPSSVAVDLSSSGYSSKPTDIPYQAFPSAISRPYNFNVELSLPSKDNPGFAGGASLGVGEILLKNSDASLDSVALLDWMEAQPDLYIGRKSDSLTNFTRFSRGTSAGVSWDLDSISILHRDQRFKLQKRLQQNLYKGFGSAVRYDGVNDRGSATLTCPAGSMTMELEACPALASATGILANWRNGTGAGLRLIYQNGTKWTFGVRNDAAGLFEAVGATTIVATTRYHVVGVLDVVALKVYLYISVNNGPLYLDGQATISGTFNTVLGTYYHGATEVGSFYFQGDSDELRVWSIVRTLNDLKGNKDKQLAGTETGLYSYWKFDESSGTTAANTVPGKPSITFTGSPAWVGSLEGDSSIAGTPKPILLGIKRQFSPKLVDAQRLVYQWHDGLGSALDSVKDGGDPYTFGSIVSDIYATTPAAGSYNVMLTANGSYFRLGSNPIGVITCDARGDAGGSLGYRAEMANIHRKVITQYGGLTDSDLNLNTYAALLLKTSAAVGFYFDSEINVDAALDQISKEGGNSWWTPDRVAKISIGRIDNPSTLTPDITVTVDDLVEPSRGGTFKRNPVGVRIGKVILGYRKYNTTLTEDQVATAVLLATRNDLKQPYRFVSATDPNASANADTMTVLTEIDSIVDAQAEADRLLDLWKVDRGTYRISMDQGVLSYFIGTIMRVVRDRYDLAGGKNFVVFGVTENMGQYGGTDTLDPALFG